MSLGGIGSVCIISCRARCTGSDWQDSIGPCRPLPLTDCWNKSEQCIEDPAAVPTRRRTRLLGRRTPLWLGSARLCSCGFALIGRSGYNLSRCLGAARYTLERSSTAFGASLHLEQYTAGHTSGSAALSRAAPGACGYLSGPKWVVAGRPSPGRPRLSSSDVVHALYLADRFWQHCSHTKHASDTDQDHSLDMK